MTSAQKRMKAEVFCKMLKKDKDLLAFVKEYLLEETEEYLNTREAAEFIGMSVGWVKKHIGEIPHTKVGRLNKFKKSSLVECLNREQFRFDR